MQGYIKLYRKMLEWQWYSDINVRVVFIHLLLKANHKKTKWRMIELEAGEFITSREHLALEVGLSIQQVRTSLDKLKQSGEIEIKTTSQYTIIKVIKWDFYQSENKEINQQITSNQPTDNQPITNNQPTDNQPITTDKNDNNEKNEENDNNEKKKGEGRENIYQQIVDMYNATCTAFPKVIKITDDRKKALNARLKKYTLGQFQRVFELAQSSDFLRGSNNRNWSATFDWLIKDSSMAKVLEGNYINKQGGGNNNGANRNTTNGTHKEASTTSKIFDDLDERLDYKPQIQV